MARLTYTMMCSLDGYVNDPAGGFDWGQIDAAVHQHANDEARRTGTHIYGRRMYEIMVYWETAEPDDPVEAEFAQLWKAADKLVVSRTLERVSSARTRLVRSLDLSSLTGEASISGPTLACQFMSEIDEVGVYYIPVLVGGGMPMFQGVSARLRRTEQVAFPNGVVFVRYEKQ